MKYSNIGITYIAYEDNMNIFNKFIHYYISSLLDLFITNEFLKRVKVFLINITFGTKCMYLFNSKIFSCNLTLLLIRISMYNNTQNPTIKLIYAIKFIF